MGFVFLKFDVVFLAGVGLSFLSGLGQVIMCDLEFMCPVRGVVLRGPSWYSFLSRLDDSGVEVSHHVV